MLHLIQIILLSAFPVLVIVAGMRDAVSFTIPNWISIALGAAFLPAALVMGVGPGEIGLALLIGLGALIAGMGMFAVGWIGGGDAKLFAAAGLWMGLGGLLPYLLITALAGGGLAVALLALRSVWMRPLAVRGPGWLSRLATPGENVPYGVAIAAGALAAFPESLLVGLFRGLS
ncbi:MAG: prepilin peptidase [Caulobacter sp.]|nr:prepilin peptidase [Caulobacter sp.]